MHLRSVWLSIARSYFYVEESDYASSNSLKGQTQHSEEILVEFEELIGMATLQTKPGQSNLVEYKIHRDHMYESVKNAIHEHNSNS